MGDNYYEVLGVSKGASADEIKRAYRSLARELHPDVRPDDAAAAERFKSVSEAWAVLSDPEKRARYDKFGDDGLREGFDPDAWSRARSGAGGFRVDMNDLGDLFGSAGFGGFGGFAGPRGGARRGEDLSYRLDVSFDDAVRGFQTRFDYRQPVSCTACSGAGFTSGGACGPCRGRGTVEKIRTVNVNVPKGASTGDRIRLKKRGGAGRGGAPAGDVVIELQVGDDPRFRREGQNLVVVARVDAVDVLLGTRVEVESLDGPIRVQVPANVRSGSRLRVRARGVERGNTRGDLFVEVMIDGLTHPLTAEGREHVLALRRALGRDSDSETAQVSGARLRGAEDEDATTGESTSRSQASTK